MRFEMRLVPRGDIQTCFSPPAIHKRWQRREQDTGLGLLTAQVYDIRSSSGRWPCAFRELAYGRKKTEMIRLRHPVQARLPGCPASSHHTHFILTSFLYNGLLILYSLNRCTMLT